MEEARSAIVRFFDENSPYDWDEEGNGRCAYCLALFTARHHGPHCPWVAAELEMEQWRGMLNKLAREEE